MNYDPELPAAAQYDGDDELDPETEAYLAFLDNHRVTALLEEIHASASPKEREDLRHVLQYFIANNYWEPSRPTSVEVIS